MAMAAKGRRDQRPENSISTPQISAMTANKNPSVSVTLKPSVRCVNPVLELLQAPKNLASVTLGGRLMKPEEYAWDGNTLWLDATFNEATTLHLEFK